MESIKKKLKYFILLSVLTSTIANDFIMRPKWRPIDSENVPQEYFFADPNEQSDIYGVDDAYGEYDSEKELDSNVPYGIQNVRDIKQMNEYKNREMKSVDHHFKKTFQSLCPSHRLTVHLNRENNEYEYIPAHYEEVSCDAPYSDHINNNNRVCGGPGYSCIQLNRTIYLTKRLKGTQCWETETKLVMAGCECMWPKHINGDISTHH